MNNIMTTPVRYFDWYRAALGPKRAYGSAQMPARSMSFGSAPRIIRRLFVVLLLLLAGASFGNSAVADDTQVKLELTPATVDLPTKGEAQTQLVLRNKSAAGLQNIAIAWFSGTEAEIKAEDSSKDPANLAAQAEKYWTVHLAQGVRGLVPGSVYFRVTYNTTGAKSVPQVLYATLTVNSRQADEVSKVVEVVPNTASTQLNEQRPGQVFLVINNKSNLPIRLGQITAAGPSFISGTADMSALPKNADGCVQIEARDSGYVPVSIKVTDTVRPGKHLLIFTVPIEWGVDEHLRKANVIAQQQFDVGILGESELLTALGLPSFLILPGFLMIVAFRLVSKRSVGDESMLKNATNPALWIVAISLSGVMAYVYPYGTKLLFGVSRNYLIGYGLVDIINVWLVSILIGLLAYLIFEVIKFLWRHLFMPAPTDDPVRLLRKLFWQRLGLSLYQLDVKISGTDRTLFLLERRRNPQATYWLGPYINIEWPATTPELKAQQATLKQLVGAELDDGSARVLANLIERGEKAKVLNASWDQTSGLNGPRQFNKEEITRDPPTKGVIAKQE
jgi:hypothetical protein